MFNLLLFDFHYSRKRSVVPYNPEESATDKKKRLESIKKKAEETRKAKTMSDLSEDFDDFEIEEESEEKVPENHGWFTYFAPFF